MNMQVGSHGYEWLIVYILVEVYVVVDASVCFYVYYFIRLLLTDPIMREIIKVHGII